MKAADAVRDSAAARRPRPAGRQIPPSARGRGRAQGGNTMTTPDGRDRHPPARCHRGAGARHLPEALQRRHADGRRSRPSCSSDAELRSAGAAAGGARRQGGSDYQFGGNYIVFVERDGEHRPGPHQDRPHRPRLRRGVSGPQGDGDSVIILPSASLVAVAAGVPPADRVVRQPGRARHAADRPTRRPRPRRARPQGGAPRDDHRRNRSRSRSRASAPTSCARRSPCWASSSAWRRSSRSWRSPPAPRRPWRSGSTPSAPTCSPVYPGQSFQMGRASDVRVSLTTDDADALARDGTLLDAVVPETPALAPGDLPLTKHQHQHHRQHRELRRGAALQDHPRADVHLRRGRRPAALCRARQLGARDAQRQPGRDHRPVDPDPGPAVRGDRRARAQGLPGALGEPR